MTARIEAIEGALTREGWDEALGQFAGATFFHQYGWAQLVRDVYDGEPHYLAAKADGSVCGLLPMMTRNVLQAGNVCISLPMADEGGILSRSGESTQALIDAAQHIGQSRQVSYIEIRQREELPGDIAADLTRVGLELSLPGTADELWDSLKATVRNQVRKAQKSGLTASVETNCHAAVDDGFYPIYSENTRDLGSPMHSRRFFHEVLSRFPDLAQLVVVREDLAPVGAAVALRWRDSMAVPWAASLRRYFDRCPNNLLYWELLRLAVEQGCRRFDFGRSAIDSGTFRFKRQWGAAPEQLRYYRIPVSHEVSTDEKRDGRAYRAFSAIWRKTPLPVARALGPRIFARLPI